MIISKNVIKKRLFVYFSNIIIIFILVLQFLNNKLMPVVYEYGKHQCINISTKLINTVVAELLTEDIKESMVMYNDGDYVSIDFNTAVLNSLSANITKKIQTYFYNLEQGNFEKNFLEKIGINLDENKIKRGIVYEIPLSSAFNNALISNLGGNVPVRYKIIGSVKTKIVSNLKEYGINNALLEINLEVEMKSMISIPIISNEENVTTQIPLVIKIIQGDIPESFFGSNIFGGSE